MDPADLIEENSDYLVTRLEYFVMDHTDLVINEPEKFAIIRGFVEWCVAEDKKDLDVPRNPDKKSFRQRREEKQEKNISELEDENRNLLAAVRQLCKDCTDTVAKRRALNYLKRIGKE